MNTERLRRLAVVLCIATTVVVATTEIAIGLIYSLISVTAEGLHTTADLADSIIAYLLVIVASRPADREHPYGHGKFDSLGALIEGSFVGITGAWATVKGAGVLLGFAEAEPRPEAVTVIVMLGAAVIYYVVSAHVLRLADITQSPLVRAEAMHLRTHVTITIGLAVGLVASNLGIRAGITGADRIDALVALILGLYLLRVAYHIILPGFSQLMDRSLPDEEVRKLTAVLDEFRDEFVEIHGVRTRGAGMDRHVDIHLVVEPQRSVESAHDLAHRIEAVLRGRMPGIRLLVHVEPAVGRVWMDYLARQRVGRVVIGDGSPLAHEADHHVDATAHQV